MGQINKKYKYNVIPGFTNYIIFKNGVIQVRVPFDNLDEADYIYPDENMRVILYADKYKRYASVNLIDILAITFIGYMNLPIEYTKTLNLITSFNYKTPDYEYNSDNDTIIINDVKFIKIPNTKNCYISEDAKIFNRTKNRFVVRSFDSKGYFDVSFEGQSHKLHRLSYSIFVGELKKGLTINHKKANKSKFNNHYSNLEQISNAENMRHAQVNGLRHNARWMPDDIHKICKMMEDNTHPKLIANSFGITNLRDLKVFYTLCFDIRSGKIWSDISTQYNLDKYDTYKFLTNAKIDRSEVYSIYKRANDGESLHVLAKEYNVTPDAIRLIKNKKRWKKYIEEQEASHTSAC